MGLPYFAMKYSLYINSLRCSQMWLCCTKQWTIVPDLTGFKQEELCQYGLWSAIRQSSVGTELKYYRSTCNLAPAGVN